MGIKIDTIHVSLVSTTGEEFDRIPWTNIYFDYPKMQVRGNDVNFIDPPAGGYCGYRLYRHDGELWGGYAFPEVVIVSDSKDGFPHTITISDLHFSLTKSPDNSMLLAGPRFLC